MSEGAVTAFEHHPCLKEGEAYFQGVWHSGKGGGGVAKLEQESGRNYRSTDRLTT